jgi:hypothetical protein
VNKNWLKISKDGLTFFHIFKLGRLFKDRNIHIFLKTVQKKIEMVVWEGWSKKS